MRLRVGVAIGVAAMTVTGVLSSVPTAVAASCGKLPVYGPGQSYHPDIDPARFNANITNPLYPLRPGTTYLYTGTKDAKNALDAYASRRRRR